MTAFDPHHVVNHVRDLQRNPQPPFQHPATVDTQQLSTLATVVRVLLFAAIGAMIIAVTIRFVAP